MMSFVQFGIERLNSRDSCGRLSLMHRPMIKTAIRFLAVQNVCPNCGHHLRVTAEAYVSILIDSGTFDELDEDLRASDPLGFTDLKPYPERIAAAEAKGKNEAVITGTGKLDGIDVAIVGLPNSGKSAVLNALTGARAPVAAYPRTTQEPAFGVMRDDAERIVLIADLPGLAEDGSPRHDGHLEQLERVKVLVHCAAQAPGAPPVAQALEMGRATLRDHVADSAVEITVATGSGDAEGADVGVDADTGDGIPDLRARILEALGS